MRLHWRRSLLLVAVAGCATFGRERPDVRIRVMSYNIQYGGKGLDSIADAIRAESPHIVALQEVDVHWSDRSKFADQATLLGAKLGMQVRFAPIYQLAPLTAGAPPREFGVAVLSRYPISNWRNAPLTRLSTQEPNAVAAPAPGLLEATIDAGGRPIRVYNTHLDYRADPAVRRRQVAEMMRYIDEDRGATIVFGDLNATPEAAELQPLFGQLTDSWVGGRGPGLTYPADAPVKRIDYVLASSHFRVLAARVLPAQASDHRAVVVDLVRR